MVTLKFIQFHYTTNEFSGSKYPKSILFNFEHTSTKKGQPRCDVTDVLAQTTPLPWWMNSFHDAVIHESDTVLLFSELNEVFFFFLDPENMFLDNENKLIFGVT